MFRRKNRDKMNHTRHSAKMTAFGLASLAALGAGALSPALAQNTNIALGKTVTGSPFYDQGTETFPYQNITDGRLDDTGSPSDWSFWLTPQGTAGYATVDLGADYNISRIVLQDTHNRGYYDRGTDAFDISVSGDGQNFTQLVSSAFTLDQRNDLDLVTEDGFAPTIGRYVKFNVDSYYGSSGGLNEMQVFGTPAPEPSAFVGLGLGVLGLAGLTVKARRRKATSA